MTVSKEEIEAMAARLEFWDLDQHTHRDGDLIKAAKMLRDLATVRSAPMSEPPKRPAPQSRAESEPASDPGLSGGSPVGVREALVEAAIWAKTRLDDFADEANAGHIEFNARELKRKIGAAFADFDRALSAPLPTDREKVIEECAKIALAIDSGRGNEKEIAKAIRALSPTTEDGQ